MKTLTLAEKFYQEHIIAGKDNYRFPTEDEAPEVGPNPIIWEWQFEDGSRLVWNPEDSLWYTKDYDGPSTEHTYAGGIADNE